MMVHISLLMRSNFWYLHLMAFLIIIFSVFAVQLVRDLQLNGGLTFANLGVRCSLAHRCKNHKSAFRHFLLFSKFSYLAIVRAILAIINSVVLMIEYILEVDIKCSFSVTCPMYFLWAKSSSKIDKNLGGG